MLWVDFATVLLRALKSKYEGISSMKSVKFAIVLIGLAVVTGCGGDSPKTAIPSANQSDSSPAKNGTVTVTNPDGTTSETSSSVTTSAVE